MGYKFLSGFPPLILVLLLPACTATTTTLPVLNSLISNGFSVRPYLGDGVYTVDQTLAPFYGLGVNQGVLITDVATGSSAEKAGFQAGGVTTALEGTAQTDDAALTDYINSPKVGTTIQITYYRGNNKNTVPVNLVQAPTS
jgi:serine protease Do